MTSHVSTCMKGASSINRSVRRRRRGEGGGGKEKRKGGKDKRKKKKRKGKEIEKDEGGRRFLPQFIGIPTVKTR